MPINEPDYLSADHPQLDVNYSPEVHFHIECDEVEGHSAFMECRCLVTCRVLYPGGHFEYVSGGLLFFIEGGQSFASFAEDLGRVKRGEASSATLTNVGEEFVFTLSAADQIFRRVHISVAVREYIADIEGFATAQLNIDTDYDLYVNKLSEAFGAFLRDLRRFAALPRR